MKKSVLTFSVSSLLLFSFSSVFSQAERLSENWCTSHDYHLKMMQTDPEYVKNQETLEAFTNEFVKNKTFSKQFNPESAVKIIPVVFHVMHVYGPENISDAQLKSQIDVLNLDFRRLNADTTSTPAPFKPIGADCQIEFRLAQLDPNGNCTSGINRVYTPLTLNADNAIKPLSVWPRDKYLNIWVVNTIGIAASAGIVIGYAQFPGGAAGTDGVVLRSNYVGTIGSAAGNQNNGRTATHEVGHWLNLIHIWGDEAACSGTDNVSDTPNQADKTFSTCPPFPLLDACTPSGNGVLFSDYMDYTRGNCQNIYTAGQAARMDATLNSSTSSRNNLWTPANILATGAGATPQLCGTDFSVNKTVACTGSNILFFGNAWNAVATTWDWDIDNNGTTDYTIQNPTHAYSTPGVYSVKLTVGDGTTTKTVTKTAMIIVLASTASLQAPYTEGFENASFPYADFNVLSTSLDVYNWDRVTTAAYTGSASIKFNNFTPSIGDIDEFITPSIDMTQMTSPTMTFRLAYARTGSADTLDQLRVLTSTNCGNSWTQRYLKGYTTLPTSSPAAGAFTPTTALWRLETVNVANITGSANARIRFEFTSHGIGNNIYIDDINISGTPTNPGVQEEFANGFNLDVFPNPSNENTTVTFTLRDKYNVGIGLYDAIGKEIIPIAEKTELNAGTYNLPIGNSVLKAGIYFLKLDVDGYVVSKKLVIQ